MGQRSMDTMTSVAMIMFTAKVLGFEHHPSKMECLVVVQWLSHVWIFVTPWTIACQTPLSTLSPGVCSNSCPLSWWCYGTISSSASLFSSHLQSFPASGSFPVGQLFASGGQSIGASTSATVLPMNIQSWFPFGFTGLISLKSKELSRVFSSPTVQKHQFFGAQVFNGPTLTSIHGYWKNHSFDYMKLCQ